MPTNIPPQSAKRRVHPQVASARAKVGALSRCVNNGEREADDRDLRKAKGELATAKITSYIEKVVASAPPLTAEQRDRIATILRGGGAA